MKAQYHFNLCATDFSTATAASTSYKGIHLNHPRNADAYKVIQPPVATKGQQQQTKGQLTFFVVADHQQAGPSRPLTLTFMPTKYFNPPSVASATGKESQYNISALSRFFRNPQSVMSYQQIDTL